ncbi:reverse transcriptase domain-containing protein [Escherichia coli]|nr:reverse transcriptase domain-containing protein [Escherichia coli]MDY9212529.1 reverse transcriptase domain-containing protein [Escherichia coli]MDY9267101.1 reverse transcriptase domain-containing protein [Escherichia coli]MDY9321884.1 reverse transcriptase domain-containing protein [Escherichia coli]MDY9326754.1 reverse transcriptase domain-containing protein [Escherichia coli]
MARDEGTPQGGPLSPLLANVLLDEVDRALQQRGHRFARYADDCNVYVRSQKAGERVLRWMRKMYEQLHLRVNEKKTEVGPVFGRKFLGYCFRRWSGNTVKIAVAPKALDTFKRRIRLITRCVGGQGMTRLPNRCGYTFEAGSPTSGWHKPRRYSKIWIHGYVTDSGLSS